VEQAVWLVSAADRNEQIRIPSQAMTVRGGIPGVFVLGEKSLARFRMVRVGKTVNGQIEVVSGLRGGEKLLVGDLTALYDGTPIKIAQ